MGWVIFRDRFSRKIFLKKKGSQKFFKAVDIFLKIQNPKIQNPKSDPMKLFYLVSQQNTYFIFYRKYVSENHPQNKSIPIIEYISNNL